MPIVEEAEKLDVGSELPVIPEGPVTEESLEAEASALGTDFTEVQYSVADLIADAEEMLENRAADLAEFLSREYAVTEFHYDRLGLLVGILAPAHTEGDAALESSKAQTKTADEALDVLLDNRRRFGAIGRAAGLPSGLFALQTKNSRRLNVVVMRMEEVLANVIRFRARLPDKKRVDELVESTRAVIAEQKTARRKAKLLRLQRQMDTLRAEQFERLLLNVLQYLSAQGEAAFAEEPARAARYALDHTYGRRTPGEPAAPVPAPAADEDAA